MKKATSLLLLLAGLAATALFTGCATDVDESTIPWSRPQSWEGGIPGLGNTN
ncbi:hypothetical protein MLD52_06400 [Puniceicoccaceae bacterium K14]|nr:hypothetical protein [Puniceicoccaceae bacterium K14]